MREVRTVFRVPDRPGWEFAHQQLGQRFHDHFEGTRVPQPVVPPSLAASCGCPELGRLFEMRGAPDTASALVRKIRSLEALQGIDIQIQTDPKVGFEPREPDLPLCPDHEPPNAASVSDLTDIDEPKHGLLLDDGRPPSFHAQQRYLGPASRNRFGGLEAAVAWALPGGRGHNVRIADIELAWGRHRDVEDRPATPGSPYQRYHGLAVEGLLAARNDGMGIDGIAPDAKVERLRIPSYKPANVASALCTAVATLDAGDVILLETQYRIVDPDGTDSDCTSPDLPHETALDCTCLMRRAVEKGIHVVQAAGNGETDIGRYLPAGLDTGSIVVAAGQPTNGSRIVSSNWGARVNLFSWGHSVVSLGLADEAQDLWMVPESCYAYFNGTSAAAAIVAGAVACLSGILKAAGKSLSPLEMRQLLVDTGYAKEKTDTKQIGVHPNLRAACLELQRRKLIPDGSVL